MCMYARAHAFCACVRECTRVCVHLRTLRRVRASARDSVRLRAIACVGVRVYAFARERACTRCSVQTCAGAWGRENARVCAFLRRCATIPDFR